MPNWGRTQWDRDNIDQPLERTRELMRQKPQAEIDLQTKRLTHNPSTEASDVSADAEAE